MATTMTFSKIDTPYAGTHGLVKVEIEWEAAAGGIVDSATFTTSETIDVVGRYCSLAVTDPGTTAPTANYDIRITDEYECDVFGGTLADRSALDTEQVVPKMGDGLGTRLCAGPWTFVVTGNSVGAATGMCVLYFEL